MELIDAVAGGEQVTRSARDHIEGCPVCRESVAALRRVRSDLSRLATMTMPGDVAERIQAALATRVPPRSGPADEPGDDQATTPSAVTDRRAAPPPGVAALTGISPARRATSVGPVPPGARPPGARLAPSPMAGGPHRGTPVSPTAPETSRSPLPVEAGTRAQPPQGPHEGASRPCQHPPTGPGSRPGGRGRRPGGHRGGPLSSAAHPAPRRDWLSIVAVCVAFVAFGTAVLAIYGLRSTSSAGTLPLAGRTPVDAAEETVAVDGSAQADLTTLADSRASLVQADVMRHALELLRGRIEGSQELPLQLTDPWAHSAAARPTSAVSARSGGAQAEPAGTTSLPAAVGGAAAVRLRALLDTPQLRMCYQSVLAMTGGKILAIDRARFDEEPALLIVVSVPMRPSAARLVVVDAQCGMTSASMAPLYSATTLRG
ncbi:hypothetical protein [Frankia sp. AgB32]|uniref:hypothetical protein n=1 Tax=Frankia sp. AgB32 TaxID=631119 RepID=UPI002010913D|nr:hypothetical protein [Frankia sp. AgB32]MCK9893289.1 hypothetical protein [Frankia sp. AgB32]